MSKSSYAEAETLKYLLTSQAMGTRPTAWFIGLHTADPSGGPENFGGAYSNYARQPVTFVPVVLSGTTTTTSNGTAVMFPVLVGAGATITHFAVYSAVTGGNMLYSSALALPKNMATGDAPKFSIGDIIISES